ncbi:heme biosynthesis operon protein HemX [Pseudomonas sp. G11-1]|nr:heme biosynthesis operon protein HemX [Pseudomonas sp. G11-1]MCO5788102.1 heme biosynthesis operon protein HemX [Pseudomonas sp. G11-2]
MRSRHKGKRVEPTKDNNQGTGEPATDTTVTPPVQTSAGTSDKRDQVTGSGATPPPTSPRSRDKHGSGKGGGRGVSILALLVGLAALGLSGWQWYQTQQLAQGQQQQLNNQLTELRNTQRQDQRSAEQRLAGLPTSEEWQQLRRLTADMQRSQQALNQRLDTLQGDARADWKLAEAEYLLRLASLRLLAAQDVTSARQLLEAVDHILQAQPDSGVFAVREQLARYQTELEALPVVDRSGLYLKLAALHDQVANLTALPVPVFDPDEVTPEEEFEDRLARRTRGERMLMRLERYVRVDFQRGKVITPLLDEAEMQRIRRTLQLTLEQAQWAVLRGEGDIYRDSLEHASGMLEQFFELDNPQVRAMQNRLQQLAEQRITIIAPDLAALQQGLAAYIQSRNAPASRGESADE